MGNSSSSSASTALADTMMFIQIFVLIMVLIVLFLVVMYIFHWWEITSNPGKYLMDIFTKGYAEVMKITNKYTQPTKLMVENPGGGGAPASGGGGGGAASLNPQGLMNDAAAQFKNVLAGAQRGGGRRPPRVRRRK